MNIQRVRAAVLISFLLGTILAFAGQPQTEQGRQQNRRSPVEVVGCIASVEECVLSRSQHDAVAREKAVSEIKSGDRGLFVSRSHAALYNIEQWRASMKKLELCQVTRGTEIIAIGRRRDTVVATIVALPRLGNGTRATCNATEPLAMSVDDFLVYKGNQLAHARALRIKELRAEDVAEILKSSK